MQPQAGSQPLIEPRLQVVPRRRGLLIIIAAESIALVVLLAALGTVLLTPASPAPPAVALGPEAHGTDSVTVDVLGADPRLPLAEFRASLFVNGARQGAVYPLSDGGTGGPLSFADIDHDGHLSQGDRFTIRLATSEVMHLSLSWKDVVVADRIWGAGSGGSGSNAPTIAFGSATETQTPGTFTLSPSGIAGGCTPNCVLSSFKFQMFNTTTTQTALCGSPPIVANTANPPWLCTSGGISLGFTDANSNGKLDTLDYFMIKGVASGTSYKVSLIWAATGGEITSGSMAK